MPNNDDRAWENNDVVWVLTSDNPESPSEVASAVPGVLQVCQGSSPRDKLTALVPTEMLEEGRAYRLYAFVRDHVPQSRGQCLPPRDGSECDVAVRWILSEGTNLHADWYPGLSPASSYSEVQDFLNKRGKCPRPCPIQHGMTEAYMNLPFKICHDATFPEPCAWEMRQLKNRLMNSSHGFPGLSSASSFQAGLWDIVGRNLCLLKNMTPFAMHQWTRRCKPSSMHNRPSCARLLVMPARILGLLGHDAGANKNPNKVPSFPRMRPKTRPVAGAEEGCGGQVIADAFRGFRSCISVLGESRGDIPRFRYFPVRERQSSHQ